MKKLVSFVSIIVFTFTLAGCGAVNTSNVKQNQRANQANTNNTGLNKNESNENTDTLQQNKDNKDEENKEICNSFILDSKVYLISNSGEQWDDVTPKNIGSKESLSNVYFLNRNLGWITTYTEEGQVYIYSTKDGGSTWRGTPIEDIKGYYANITFLDENNGWILVHQGAAMMHEEVSLLGTADGGETWNVISKTNVNDPKDKGIPFAGDKYGFSFSDKENGWILGYSPVPGQVYMVVTNDEGKTWNMKNMKLPDKYKGSESLAYSVNFFSNKEGIIPINIIKDKRVFAVYNTSDGGETWTLGQSIEEQENRNMFWSFYDKAHGFATDGKDLYITNDSGITWNKVNSNINYDEITNLIFINDRLGWVITRNGKYKTTDGGVTWN